jgi:hypothetical protein
MMTLEDMKIAAPAAFCEHPVEEVSKRYVFIPTTRLIEDLNSLGWHEARANQPKSRKSPLTAKHRIIFRSDEFPMTNGLVPELITTNSHDRSSAFVFFLGLFRQVCSNGLCVLDSRFEEFRIRHIYYEFEGIRELVNSTVLNIPNLMSAVERLKLVMMTKEQQEDFAFRALALRFPEYVRTNKTINISQIAHAVDVPAFLTPYRPEDEGNAVWAVYNRIQEKLIKGKWSRIGLTDNVSKKVRKVENIGLDIKLNTGLWQMANSYAI